MTHKTVDTSVICTWLGIPPDQWPPDHYTLLGLAAAEPDVDRIERQVQQRLEEVRRYQLANPEPATEAMNRIAQAFVCLTDPQARRAYDRTLFGDVPAYSPVTPTTPTPLPAVFQQPASDALAVDPEFLSLVEEEARATETVEATVAQTASAEPVKVEEQPGVRAVETAPRETGPARRGLGTRRACYERIVHLRSLLRLWERAGRFLTQTRKRLTRPSEARELIEILTAIREGLRHLPPLIGEAGQPGYLVVTLARQQAIVPTFQTLLPSQREALSRDWSVGQKALQEQHRYLREESRARRRQNAVQQLVRSFRTFLNEHPGGWIIALGVVALALVLVRRFFSG